MKCISLWQPWATLVVIGAKKFETRHWEWKYRGDLLIHAAKIFDQDSMALCLDEPFRSVLIAAGFEKLGDLPRGAIVGKTSVVSSSHAEDLAPWLDKTELAFGNYATGRFAMKLADEPIRFATPVMFKGRQSFFSVPDDVVADQLAKARAA